MGEGFKIFYRENLGRLAANLAVIKIKVPHMQNLTENTFFFLKKKRSKRKTRVSIDDNSLIWEMHKRSVKEVGKITDEDCSSSRDDNTVIKYI